MVDNKDMLEFLMAQKGNAQHTDAVEELREMMDQNWSRINIMVMGQTGVGKSTLVNAMFGENLAKTGICGSVTRGIVEYSGGNYSLFDTEGLELDLNQQKNLIQSICTFIQSRAKEGAAKQIHMIWYCISASSSRLQTGELELLTRVSSTIKESKVPIPVVFVITKPYALSNADWEIFRKCIEEVVEPLFPGSSGRIIRVQSIPYKVNYLSQEFSIPASGLKELDDMVEGLLPKALGDSWVRACAIDVKKKVKLAKRILTKDAIAVAGIAAGATALSIDDSLALIGAEIYLCAKVGSVFNFKFDSNKVYATVAGSLGVVGASMVGKSLFSWILSGITGGVSKLIELGVRVGIAEVVVVPFGLSYIALMERFARGEIDETAAMDAMEDLLIKDAQKHKKNRDDVKDKEDEKDKKDSCEKKEEENEGNK